MFSGIIKDLGTVHAVEQNGTTLSVWITSDISPSLTIDQSISHNGVCLTVVALGQNMHQVDIIQETQTKTTFHRIQKGDLVHLEKSVTPSSYLDGHLVQGHVDTTLRCIYRVDKNGSWLFAFHLPSVFANLVISHGSICLDGVSLTVANLYEDSFEVAIIPYTYHHTRFNQLTEGMEVNVEFDLIGKYILRQQQLSSR